ncbi:hypothetical protein [Streptomyces iranensis]|uniref:Uncharacterized protein n=1 Tax=Streptomyces iranensis TaxID=576784 RepID=A0A061A1T1_9ACTN|nr:hypothetical protein [Streptomyces iranensis]MBP2061479.1 hypothetical protein [Streptomyces iranensis]CDR09703.1 predicted protein [Streptomyces iranensis]
MSTPSPIEERLRAALDARARLIDAHDLSPYRPPNGPAWGARRIRRVVSAVAVTVAAAAAVAFLLLSGSPERPHPAPPARDPRPSPPATSVPSTNTAPPTRPSPTFPPATPPSTSTATQR